MSYKKNLFRSFHLSLALLLAAVPVAGILTVQSASAAGGGGDPCADGVPDAIIYLPTSTKGVGSLDVSLIGKYSIACKSPIVSYAWDFGDGTTSDSQDVTHTYGVGSFTPTLTITDQQGLTNTQVYYTAVNVKADNQNPVLADATQDVLVGQSKTVDLSGLATDPDSDNLAGGFYLVGAPYDGYGSINTGKGSVNMQSSNGQFSYYGFGNASGTDSFQVGVRDGYGGVATATVTINLIQYVTAVSDNTTTVSGQPVTVNVTNNDYSYDGRAFSVYWYWGSDNGDVINNQDGTFTFKPNPGFVGNTSFQYGISDNGYDPTAHKSTTTVNVTVTPAPTPTPTPTPTPEPVHVNTAPTAASDRFGTNEDTTVTGNVLLNDSDVDGDSLSVALGSGPSNGSVQLNANGTFSYTPKANWSGIDSFKYTVSDGKGGTSTTEVTIVVSAVNDAPVASFTAVASNGKNLSVNGVASTDIEGPLASYSWNFGDGASATGVTAQHRYTKPGTYTVLLTVTDNQGLSTTTSKSVQVK
jgi:PKD repeat protein